MEQSEVALRLRRREMRRALVPYVGALAGVSLLLACFLYKSVRTGRRGLEPPVSGPDRTGYATVTDITVPRVGKVLPWQPISVRARLNGHVMNFTTRETLSVGQRLRVTYRTGPNNAIHFLSAKPVETGGRVLLPPP